MNSFIIEVASLENRMLDNKNMFSRQIYNSLLEIIKENKNKKLKVSNIFGMFFENEIKIVKNKKYKIRIITEDKEIFFKITEKLFEIALNKERIKFGEAEFVLREVISSDRTWCGEYSLDEELEKISENDCNFYKNISLKIVTPIIINKSSIYKFENILKVIIKEIKEKKKIENFSKEIDNSIIVKSEKYVEKKKTLLNDKIKKIILGDINLELRGYYGKYFYAIMNYIRFSGVGEYKEFGFGEIIVK